MNDDKKGITLSKKSVKGFADVVTAFDKYLKEKGKGKLSEHYYAISILQDKIDDHKYSLSRKGRIPKKRREGLRGIIVQLESAIQLIQQKPKIDEKYVEEKAIRLRADSLWYDNDGVENYSISRKEAEEFITQIISDVKGMSKK